MDGADLLCTDNFKAAFCSAAILQTFTTNFNVHKILRASAVVYMKV